jgi:hypothetical protein
MNLHPDLKNKNLDPQTPEGRYELRTQLYSSLEDRCREASASMDAISVMVKMLGDPRLSEILADMAEKQKGWSKQIRTLAIELEVEKQKNK